MPENAAPWLADLTTAQGIGALLSRNLYRFRNEHQLHEGLAEVMTAAGIEFAHEVHLTETDRPDFVAEPGIAIEVKVAGKRADVLRQMNRYADSDRIRSLLLVSTRPHHLDMPPSLNGKQLTTVVLGGYL